MKVEAVADLGAILGVWAHPDDETYLSGRLMAANDAEWVRRFRVLHARYVAALRAQDSQTAPLVEALGLERWREWIRAEAFTPAERSDAQEATTPQPRHTRAANRPGHGGHTASEDADRATPRHERSW